MEKAKKLSIFPPRVLATDLDGTLIPLPEYPENRTDLARIAEGLAAGGHLLIFCTGRHAASVEEALREVPLPRPAWMICSVGTEIYEAVGAEAYRPLDAYAEHLHSLTGEVDREAVHALLADLPGLTLQCAAHQGPFKISYDCPADALEALVTEVSGRLMRQELPFQVLGSVDPFTGGGLVDLLPRGVHKAYALFWLLDHLGLESGEVVYAGDSGNDLAALTAGFRAVLVGNASEALAAQVTAKLEAVGMTDRLHRAAAPASSGVLEGCRHFGLLPSAVK